MYWSFKEYLNAKGGYFATIVSDETQHRIKNILSIIGVPGELAVEEMHCTLMYDVSEPNVTVPIFSDISYDAKIKDIDMLGEDGSEYKAIVFMLESEKLVKRHENIKSFGFTHSYEDFLPHVSLMYTPKEEHINTILSRKEELISTIDTINFFGEIREYIQ